MCRFLVYKGSDEILLSKLILDPAHSILKQSFDCRLLKTPRGSNNADGFGIGFYTDPRLGAAPCLFTSTLPAWNCANLQRIASKTASRLIFAHLRATTEGGIISEDNCHPFCHSSLMWMHNGQIGRWRYVKRRLADRLSDRWYLFVRGTTDSEWAFALFLDTLDRMGVDPSSEPAGGFNPALLRLALMRTIHIINELTDSVDVAALPPSEDTRSLLNFAISDGHTVVCTRYIDSATDQAASLYYSSGSEWRARPSAVNDRHYEMERRDKGADIVLVASEPLTFERENWVNVPTNSVLTIHKQTVMVHPIVDQYYDNNPCHIRSSDYVQTQGLVSNEKASSNSSLLMPSLLTPPNRLVSEPKPDPSAHNHAPALLATDAAVSCSLAPDLLPPHAAIAVLAARFPRPSASMPDQQAASPLSTLAALRLSTPSLSMSTARSATSSSSRTLGNISRKRASLPALDRGRLGIHLVAPVGGDPDDDVDNLLEPPSPSEYPPPRTEFGNPNKLARFFPELALSQ